MVRKPTGAVLIFFNIFPCFYAFALAGMVPAVPVNVLTKICVPPRSVTVDAVATTKLSHGCSPEAASKRIPLARQRLHLRFACRRAKK